MRMAHGAPMHVQERFRAKKSGGDKLHKRIAPNDSALLSSEQTLRVCRRFYVALMLSRLVQVTSSCSGCHIFCLLLIKKGPFVIYL